VTHVTLERYSYLTEFKKKSTPGASESAASAMLIIPGGTIKTILFLCHCVWFLRKNLTLCAA
jgi:hypothetical protein